MSTLWYHDHRFDFTAQNVYKGMAGMYHLFNERQCDGGDGIPPALFRDCRATRTSTSHGLQRRRLRPRHRQLAFDLFNLDGILGDKFLVNGKIQPVFRVHPRRYRFRWLNMGPSRFYQFCFLDPTNNPNEAVPAV